MSQVIEVSEGVPVDGRMFETPRASQDHQKPRYITFLGSLVDRETITSKPWTKGGGMIVANPCLRYVKNFVRKGRITPVLKDTHDYRPADLWKRASEGDSSYFQQPIPEGYTPPLLPEGGGPSKYGYMMGKLALPGEQITAIVDGTSAIAHGGQRRGVVEITTLKGQDYSPQDVGNGVYVDPVIWEIQRAIFPDYPLMPVLIDDVGRLIEAAKQHTMIRDIVDDFEKSWQLFRDYATVTIHQTHTKMRETAAANGYIPTYTAKDMVLLEQLGLSRQDEEIRKNAAPTTDPELREMFKQFIALQIEEKQALKERAARTEGIDQNTMAAAPIAEGHDGYPGASGYSGFSGEVAQQNAVSPTVYTCECGKTFPKPQGLSLHKVKHCPLKKEVEVPEA